MFAAVPGEQEDGYDHIPQAIERGAVCILCQQPPQEEIPYLLVEDSRRALAQVSAAFYGYPAEQLTLLGVTGTNGKTTCTQLLWQILPELTGEKVGLIGTNGNFVGDVELPAQRTTPESLDLQRLLTRMVEAGCRYVVMEVSSHALALSRVEGLHFRTAAFTNLTQDHLDYHKTMEAYAAAKAMLFTSCDYAVYNGDDPWGERMIRDCGVPRLSYGQGLHCDLTGWQPVYDSRSVRFTAVSDGASCPVFMPIPGEFSMYNALTVLAVLLSLGIPLEASAAALKRCHGVRGRIEALDLPTPYTVLIDYAHTPDGLKNVLDAVRGFTEGRIITVFGCGGDRDKGKRPKMARTAQEGSDQLILTSDNPRTESPYAILLDILAGLDGSKPFAVLEQRRDAIAYALQCAHKGDVVLLAGKGHETYQIRGSAVLPLDERKIVRELLDVR